MALSDNLRTGTDRTDRTDEFRLFDTLPALAVPDGLRVGEAVDERREEPRVERRPLLDRV